MNISRLKKIIAYSDLNRDSIAAMVRNFYFWAGMNIDKEVLNIMQIVRTALHNKGYLIFEIPFSDDEIGALCYKGDSLGYIVLNTSLPKANVNFALCHEIYHAFFQKSEFNSKIEFSNDRYYEHEEEFAANLFAGMLLMPETGFRYMYHRFWNESSGNELDTILRLMNYYQVPYMAALVRCYELGLPDNSGISEELLNMSHDTVRARFTELWLDDSILCATGKDDYKHIEAVVERFGKTYIGESYLNERTLQKVLQNMGALYAEIKGE